MIVAFARERAHTVCLGYCVLTGPVWRNGLMGPWCWTRQFITFEWLVPILTVLGGNYGSSCGEQASFRWSFSWPGAEDEGDQSRASWARWLPVVNGVL